MGSIGGGDMEWKLTIDNNNRQRQRESEERTRATINMTCLCVCLAYYHLPVPWNTGGKQVVTVIEYDRGFGFVLLLAASD